MTEVGSISSSSRVRASVLQGLRQAVYDEPHGPLPAMLLALTVLAGVVDATSILRLGHVFVATVTGNIVFLALGAAGAKGFSVGTAALALGGFVIGVAIGGRACEAAGSHRGRALRNVLAVKLWFAFTVTLIAVFTGPKFPVGARDAMLVLLAMSMGDQLAAIRFLKVPDLLTVVLTMTLTGVLSERKRGWRDPAMLRRGLCLLAFAVGAFSGAADRLRERGGGAGVWPGHHRGHDNRFPSGVAHDGGLGGAPLAPGSIRRPTCHLVCAVKRQVCQRIGHGGASALAPANTLASFDMAREIGVDIVEFDVRCWRGELVLAHTRFDAPRPWNLRLQEALSYLSGPDFKEIELNVDVKQLGCESALVDELRSAGLLSRTVICSQMAVVLDRVRALEPQARVGISVGGRVARLSQRWRDWREQVLAGLAARRWDALMAQHRLVDSRLLEDVVARSGLLYAWTVNERTAIEALRRLGVHGIATSDPRLFTA